MWARLKAAAGAVRGAALAVHVSVLSEDWVRIRTGRGTSKGKAWRGPCSSCAPLSCRTHGLFSDALILVPALLAY